MKLIFSTTLLLAFVFTLSKVDAQDTETYIEKFKADFESPFAVSPTGCTKLDCEVMVQPYIIANEAKTTSRVYAEIKSPISGKSSLGMTPTSTFNPQIAIKINVTEISTIKKARIFFDAKSMKNGNAQDTKYTFLNFAASWDNGKSFSKEIVIDTFLNTNGKVENYITYTNNVVPNPDTLILRFTGIISKDSAGTVAKVIIDNLRIETSSSLLAIENVIDASSSLEIVSQNEDYILLNKSISGILFAVWGGEVTTLKDTEKINISDLPNGIYVVKTTENQILKINIHQ